MFRCAARHDGPDDVFLVCDEPTESLYRGTSYCLDHLKRAIGREESASGLAGMISSLEKITVEDAERLLELARPLMGAMIPDGDPL